MKRTSIFWDVEPSAKRFQTALPENTIINKSQHNISSLLPKEKEDGVSQTHPSIKEALWDAFKGGENYFNAQILLNVPLTGDSL